MARMRATTVRFGTDLWELLEREAARTGVSVAQYVREAALARIAYTAGALGEPVFGQPESPGAPMAQRMQELSEAAEAIHSAEKELAVGLVHSPGPSGETEVLLERAHHLTDLGASRVLIHDPAGSLDPARARELVERVGEASGLPVGLHCQGAGGAALAAALEAVRADAAFVACALYPVALSLHRVSAESLAHSLAGLGLDSGVDLEALWRGSELVDDALGDVPVPPLSPRVAVRAAEHSLPAGLVAELDANLRGHGFSDRLDEVLGELAELRRECGWPPLANTLNAPTAIVASNVPMNRNVGITNAVPVSLTPRKLTTAKISRMNRHSANVCG